MKGKSMQRMMLKAWLNKISSIAFLSKLEAIPCQWKSTKLTIFATRTLTPVHTTTYRKGSFSLPKAFNQRAEQLQENEVDTAREEKGRSDVDDEFNLTSDSTHDPDDYDIRDDYDCKMDVD